MAISEDPKQYADLLLLKTFSEPPKGKPEIIYQGTALETQNYTAECSQTLNNNATVWYQWRKDGILIVEETKSFVLFIPFIQRTDAGNYTCRGRNVAGYADSVPVEIIVHCKSVY